MRTIEDLRAVFDDWEQRVDDRLRIAAPPAPPTPEQPERPTFHGVRARRVVAPLASAAVVAAVVVGVLALSGTSGRQSAPPARSLTSPARTGTAPPATSLIATARVGAGQYGYLAKTTESIGGNGRTRVINRSETWIAANGSQWLLTSTGRKTDCEIVGFAGHPSSSGPTARFVAAMPTDPSALVRYLDARVQGSSSRQEAVFVAVGDLLRVGDDLASTELRAAFVAVLGRTAGVQVDAATRDPAGRPAIRASFVDPQRRPTDIASLYFQPGTYRLLAEADSAAGRPVPPADAPSVPYSQAPTTSAPMALTRPVTATLTTAWRVVDRLPERATAPTCVHV